MTNLPTQLNVSKLSIAERIVLVQNIWDSIVAEQKTIGLSEAQKAELDRRLDEHKNSPDDVVSWQDVKESL
jgi:putative addiction module component (TIGR02574 family)